MPFAQCTGQVPTAQLCSMSCLLTCRTATPRSLARLAFCRPQGLAATILASRYCLAHSEHSNRRSSDPILAHSPASPVQCSSSCKPFYLPRTAKQVHIISTQRIVTSATNRTQEHHNMHFLMFAHSTCRRCCPTQCIRHVNAEVAAQQRPQNANIKPTTQHRTADMGVYKHQSQTA